MSAITIDHIVVSVTNLKRSTNFYSKFLGKINLSKWDASWKLAGTRLFLTFPYKKKARKFDKHNLGLNHIAFGLKNITSLKHMAEKLTAAKIPHSGIMADKYSDNPMIWFDDPDGIRLEFYIRVERKK
jgi:glyoxylase I family protein